MGGREGGCGKERERENAKSQSRECDVKSRGAGSVDNAARDREGLEKGTRRRHRDYTPFDTMTTVANARRAPGPAAPPIRGERVARGKL